MPQQTYRSLLSIIALAAIGAFAVGLMALGGTPSSAHTVGSNQSDGNLQTMALQPVGEMFSLSDATGGPAIEVIGDAAVVAPQSPQSDELAESHHYNSSKQASIYVVREGDTLSEVAEMFRVSVDTIVWANNISGGSISPGDVLVILPVSGVRHEAEEGDTISSIADRYDVSVDDIREYNQLDEDDVLSVGAIIDVPGGEMPEQTQPTQARSSVQVAGGGAVTPTQTTAVSSGYYIHPVPGSVVTQRLHGYNAVDFGAPSGTSIVAAASGRVITSVNSGWNGGYGKFIVIEHPNGTRTLYSHLSSIIVSRGQNVVAGQVIGYIGSSGRSTGPHLHFEIRGAHNPFASCGLRTRCGS
ncbi:MAG: M23 family metallopeptidase [Candidatus Paceibacterota bacterium]